MAEKLINKGALHEIYSISEKPTSFNTTQFENATIETVGLKWSHMVNYVEDFKRLRMFVEFIVVAKETETPLIIASLTRDFRIVRKGDFKADDFLVVMDFCV